ncbi:MAG: hypothetical protein LBF61_12095 [Azoarcus sp.]|jgi:hypothetical protein|nr:hypothetical protein [Azoarcus sp.]
MLEAIRNFGCRTGGVPYYLPALCLGYFCILMIPEAFWETIGLETINQENIPDFVLAMMKRSRFPMSIYVHWLVTPFFTLTSTFIWAKHYLFDQDIYKEYLLRGEERLAKGGAGGAWYSAILTGVIFVIMPIGAALFFTEETTDTVLRRLQPFHYKLSFFFFLV